MRKPRGSRSSAPDIIVGLGARSSASTAEILALIDDVLADSGFARSDIAACATFDRKHGHPAMLTAASELNVPLLAVTALDLTRPVPNPSQKVRAVIGLPSVAEAAALNFGPLVAKKRRSRNATCALSRRPKIQAIEATAASTLSTSTAGP